jgi:hypothetical protein
VPERASGGFEGAVLSGDEMDAARLLDRSLPLLLEHLIGGDAAFCESLEPDYDALNALMVGLEVMLRTNASSAPRVAPAVALNRRASSGRFVLHRFDKRCVGCRPHPVAAGIDVAASVPIQTRTNLQVLVDAWARTFLKGAEPSKIEMLSRRLGEWAPAMAWGNKQDHEYPKRSDFRKRFSEMQDAAERLARNPRISEMHAGLRVAADLCGTIVIPKGQGRRDFIPGGSEVMATPGPAYKSKQGWDGKAKREYKRRARRKVLSDRARCALILGVVYEEAFGNPPSRRDADVQAACAEFWQIIRPADSGPGPAAATWDEHLQVMRRYYRQHRQYAPRALHQGKPARVGEAPQVGQPSGESEWLVIEIIRRNLRPNATSFVPDPARQARFYSDAGAENTIVELLALA